jgi:hypothetical protein
VCFTKTDAAACGGGLGGLLHPNTRPRVKLKGAAITRARFIVGFLNPAFYSTRSTRRKLTRERRCDGTDDAARIEVVSADRSVFDRI